MEDASLLLLGIKWSLGLGSTGGLTLLMVMMLGTLARPVMMWMLTRMGLWILRILMEGPRTRLEIMAAVKCTLQRNRRPVMIRMSTRRLGP
jgi:hypothetical protein